MEPAAASEPDWICWSEAASRLRSSPVSLLLPAATETLLYTVPLRFYQHMLLLLRLQLTLLFPLLSCPLTLVFISYYWGI